MDATRESSDSDSIIGEEVEKEFEQSRIALGSTIPEQKAKTTPKRKKLTNLERLKLIDAFRQGKTDKFYNVIPDKKKPGDYRIVRRRKPLNVPISDSEPINMDISQQSEPIKQYPVEEKKDKNNKFKHEFYAMQNTINNSLSKEIAACMEKCNKIEAKLKKQKQVKKSKRQQEYIEEEVIDDGQTYGLHNEVEQYNEQYEGEQYGQYEGDQYEGDQMPRPVYYRPFSARRNLDLRNI